MAEKKDLLQSIKGALNDLTRLHIVTAVGSVKKKEDGCEPDDDAKRICTTIDLIDGDITTIIDPSFVDGPYKELRQYHADREKQGSAIIKQNVEALEALLKLATNTAIVGSGAGTPADPAPKPKP